MFNEVFWRCRTFLLWLGKLFTFSFFQWNTISVFEHSEYLNSNYKRFLVIQKSLRNDLRSQLRTCKRLFIITYVYMHISPSLSFGSFACLTVGLMSMGEQSPNKDNYFQSVSQMFIFHWRHIHLISEYLTNCFMAIQQVSKMEGNWQKNTK